MSTGFNPLSEDTSAIMHNGVGVITYGANGLISGIPINPNFGLLTLSNVLSTIDWDCNLGVMAYLTLNANKTFNMPTNIKNSTYILYVKNDPVTARTITWNIGIIWPQGIPPDLGTINSLTIMSFVSNGTNWYGSYTPY